MKQQEQLFSSDSHTKNQKKFIYESIYLKNFPSNMQQKFLFEDEFLDADEIDPSPFLYQSQNNNQEKQEIINEPVIGYFAHKQYLQDKQPNHYNTFNILVKFPRSKRQCRLQFDYTKQTTCKELIQYLKQCIEEQFVVFKSNDIYVNHFLTLCNQKVYLLRTSDLILNVYFLKNTIYRKNSLERFTFIRTICSYKAGSVHIAEVYGIYTAVKLYPKYQISKREDQFYLINQKNIMIDFSKYSFMPKLYYAFQSHQYYGFAMEYLNGNTLRKYIKNGPLSNDKVKFIFVQLLYAVKILHQHKYAHRDLKPDNIMLDNQGHLKLIDYEFAKYMDNYDHQRNCGTKGYTAPEVINGSYNYTCDIFSLGVVLYELLIGTLPFKNKKLSIQEQDLDIQEMSSIDKYAKDLIQRLLIFEPDYRIQLKDIFKHQWLSDICIDDVISKKIKSPFRIYNFISKSPKNPLIELGLYQDCDPNIIKDKCNTDPIKKQIIPNFYYESQEMQKIRLYVQSQKNPKWNQNMRRQEVNKQWFVDYKQQQYLSSESNSILFMSQQQYISKGKNINGIIKQNRIKQDIFDVWGIDAEQLNRRILEIQQIEKQSFSDLSGQSFKQQGQVEQKLHLKNEYKQQILIQIQNQEKILKSPNIKNLIQKFRGSNIKITKQDHQNLNIQTVIPLTNNINAKYNKIKQQATNKLKAIKKSLNKVQALLKQSQHKIAVLRINNDKNIQYPEIYLKQQCQKLYDNSRIKTNYLGRYEYFPNYDNYIKKLKHKTINKFLVPGNSIAPPKFQEQIKCYNYF